MDSRLERKEDNFKSEREGSFKTRKKENSRIYVEFDSTSSNEALARVIAAAFLTKLDPTLDEIEDVKTAVSEAVTNAIIHGYGNEGGIVFMECTICEDEFKVMIRDEGVGIENIEKAKEPLYTTKEDDDRSGMGFSFMEIFMDSLEVESEISKGTTIIMKKKIGGR